jgi:PAS domain S-box-containing protein
MTAENKSREELQDELAELRQRLEEAEDTLRAIREGEVDAVMVSTPAGDHVYTLKGADETYRQLIEAINEGVALLATDGDILYANRKLAQILRLPLERVIGSSMRRQIYEADQETFEALFSQAGKPGTGEVYLRAGGETLTPVQLSFGSLQFDHSPRALSLVVTDLTQQKRNEAIVAEGRLCSQILLQAEQPILICDDSGQIIKASQGAHLLCTRSPLFCSFPDVFPLRHPSTSETFSLGEVIQGNTVYGEEMVCRQRDGTESYFLVNAGPLVIAGQENSGCVVALTDITARKLAEMERQELLEKVQQSEEDLQAQNEELNAQTEELKAAHISVMNEKKRLEAVMEALPIGMAILDKRGGTLRTNKAFEMLWGSPFPWCQEVNDYEAFKAWWVDTGKPVQAAEWASAQAVQRGEIVVNQVMKIERFDGQPRFVMNSAAPILDANDKITGSVVAIQDITELKQAEKTIKASLKEKEVLLQEIHHRTKNNMNVICSLLSLQSSYIDDAKIEQLFQETQNRIRSMALVHEKLYQTQDLSNIDLGEYIADLASSVMANYHVTREKISLILAVESIMVNIETAMPCGLIINELISNALKYAFPEARTGTIGITLRKTPDGQVDLRVADDGVGLPPGVDMRNKETLGMQLIANLAEYQLHGELELHNKQGTEFHLRFQA